MSNYEFNGLLFRDNFNMIDHTIFVTNISTIRELPQ